MLKKIILTAAVVAMGTVLLPCFSTSVNATQLNKETKGAVTKTTADYMPDNNYQIVVYSWNGEVENRVGYFIKQYPQYKFRIKCVSFNVSSVDTKYWEYVKKYAFGGNNNTAIVAMDSWVVRDYISNFDNMSAVGVSTSDYANAYDYTKKIGNYGGQLKAVAWQVCPGGFIYNASIAQKVLGTSDPVKVQAYISTPERFLETAEKMKNAGFYMASGFERFAEANGDKDISNSEWLEAKYLYNQMKAKGYAPNYATWSDEWYDGAGKQDVFGYVGTTWFANFSLPNQNAKYRVCQGPVSYAWGGTYLGVTNTGINKSNDKLAEQLLEYLACDTNTMTNMAKQTGDFPNNQRAVQNLKSAGFNPTKTMFNQNPIMIWDDMAKNVMNEPCLASLNGKICLVNPNTKQMVKATGFYIYRDKLYYVVNGVVNMTSGVVKVQGKYYYVQRGALVTTPTLVKYAGTYWYMNNGTICNTKTLVKYGGKYYYVANGKLNKGTTLVKYNGAYWYVSGGQLRTITDLVKYNGKYHYIKKGKFDSSFNGIITKNGKKWKVVKGIVVGSVK